MRHSVKACQGWACEPCAVLPQSTSESSVRAPTLELGSSPARSLRVLEGADLPQPLLESCPVRRRCLPETQPFSQAAVKTKDRSLRHPGKWARPHFK